MSLALVQCTWCLDHLPSKYILVILLSCDISNTIHKTIFFNWSAHNLVVIMMRNSKFAIAQLHFCIGLHTLHVGDFVDDQVIPIC